MVIMVPELPRHIVQKIFYLAKIENSATKLQNAWKRIYMRRCIIYKKVIKILEDVNFGFKYYYNKNIEIYCIKIINRISCKSIKNDWNLKNNLFLYYSNLLNMHLLSRDISKIRTYERIYYNLYKELPSSSYDTLM
jgi:hypothetical protein